MFIKLKNNINITDYEILDEHISFGLTVEGQFKGIKYFNARSLMKETALSVIPERYRGDFGFEIMQINHAIPPHTDSYIKCTLNFYIKTELCSTEFFTALNGTPKTFQIANQTNGHIYDPADLMPIGGFIAKPGEVWLLDTTIPHNVTPLSALTERVALSIATRKHDYAAVCEMLKETGAL